MPTLAVPSTEVATEVVDESASTKLDGEASPISTKVLLALGTESHAAASVLQRTYHRRAAAAASVNHGLGRGLRGCLRRCCYTPPSDDSLYGTFDGTANASWTWSTTVSDRGHRPSAGAARPLTWQTQSDVGPGSFMLTKTLA
jgi:hypothetical protein